MIHTSYQKLLTIKKQLLDTQFDYWNGYVVFTFDWWFLVILSVLGWIAWWKTVDRTNFKKIVMYGSFIIIITTILDGIGIE